MGNESYYFKYPTGRDPRKTIVIPDMVAFKAKIERLEALGKSAVTNSLSYALEANRMKLILSMYNEQEAT